MMPSGSVVRSRHLKPQYAVEYFRLCSPSVGGAADRKRRRLRGTASTAAVADEARSTSWMKPRASIADPSTIISAIAPRRRQRRPLQRAHRLVRRRVPRPGGERGLDLALDARAARPRSQPGVRGQFGTPTNSQPGHIASGNRHHDPPSGTGTGERAMRQKSGWRLPYSPAPCRDRMRDDPGRGKRHHASICARSMNWPLPVSLAWISAVSTAAQPSKPRRHRRRRLAHDRRAVRRRRRRRQARALLQGRAVGAAVAEDAAAPKADIDIITSSG